MKNQQIVICGAGIAGIATAFYLSTRHGIKDIILIDKLLPMSLTTSKSGENYRDYWPQSCMTEFVSHSLDLMEQLRVEYAANTFNMHEIGYDFISEGNTEIFPSTYEVNSDSRNYLTQIRDKSILAKEKSYLAKTINQVVHVERAGVVDVYALGSLMLTQAKKAGVKFKQALITDISKEKKGGFILSIGHNGVVLKTDQLVLAAGPFIAELAKMLGVHLPVENYLQHKFIIPDPQKAIPRNMPFTIIADKQFLNWSDEDKQIIQTEPEYAYLLDEFPAGLHIKPEGREQIKMGWAYNKKAEFASWEPHDNSEFADIVVRGASRFIPALEQYIDNVPTPIVHFSGYYTRTKENWPIIGPLEVDGLYAVGALSGYGTMSACAAGELCANFINQTSVPDYARYFHPKRYDDETIRVEIDTLSSDGQL